jgi:3-hydroxyisobutyrate dehydrogenase-like beta-hydroxyacid dehydrogenase
MTGISVLGLGDMGHALAQTLIDTGQSVTVWNRSPERTRPFADQGVTVASSAAQAIGANPLVLICISTHTDTMGLIRDAAEQVRGRTIVDLSTGDGPTARAFEEAVDAIGGNALVGMILAGPVQIGEAETAILTAGSPTAWQSSEEAIRTLAPASDYVGANTAHLADLFSALFLPRQGALFGMIYGAHFCEVAGIPLEVYIKQLPAAMRVATSLYAQAVADSIPSSDFTGSGSPLKVYEQAFRDGFAAFRGRGANMELSDLFEDLIARGMKAGYGEERMTALIKVLRDSPD